MRYLVLLFFMLIVQMGHSQEHPKIDGTGLLGYPARQLPDSTKTQQGVQKQKLEYQAIRAEQSHLYVSIESYPSETAAQKMMSQLNAQNRGMQGWEQAPGFGDEAIKDSDGEHFRLVIVRKGHHIMRLKINRLTPASASLQKLLQSAQDIIKAEK